MRRCKCKCKCVNEKLNVRESGSHLGATAVGAIRRRGAFRGPPGVVMAMVVLVAVLT